MPPPISFKAPLPRDMVWFPTVMPLREASAEVVTLPVMLMLPVPVILLLFKSKIFAQVYVEETNVNVETNVLVEDKSV